jgi:hypothetical protein
MAIHIENNFIKADPSQFFELSKKTVRFLEGKEAQKPNWRGALEFNEIVGIIAQELIEDPEYKLNLENDALIDFFDDLEVGSLAVRVWDANLEQETLVYKYQVMRQVFQTVWDYSKTVCRDLEYLDSGMNVEVGLIRSLLFEVARKNEYYESVVESKTIDDFIENMNQFKMYLYSYDFFGIIKSMSPQCSSYFISDIMGCLAADLQETLGDVVCFRDNEDTTVQMRILAKMSARLKAIGSIPQFKLLEPAHPEAVIFRPAPIEFAKKTTIFDLKSSEA